MKVPLISFLSSKWKQSRALKEKLSSELYYSKKRKQSLEEYFYKLKEINDIFLARYGSNSKILEGSCNIESANPKDHRTSKDNIFLVGKEETIDELVELAKKPQSLIPRIFTLMCRNTPFVSYTANDATKGGLYSPDHIKKEIYDCNGELFTKVSKVVVMD